jgi:hypothetical protein
VRIISRLSAIFFFGTITFHSWSQGNDRFADIGNKAAATRLSLLTTPKPPVVRHRPLPLHPSAANAFVPMNKLDTKEELAVALHSIRNLYAPYLQNLAPKAEVTRTRITLQSFDWRIETEEDRKDFSRVLGGEGKWEKVKLPHYGPPLGKAVTYYRSVLAQPAFDVKQEAMFLMFKGVDYRASVFINGNLCGTNEGSFISFEFNIAPYLKNGNNILVIKVENDYPMLGHVGDDGKKFDGDKVYAATGMGYDDPVLGWHHNPPAMGINQEVYLERRPLVHITDVFVRPLGNTDSAEVWIEVQNASNDYKEITIRHSLFGQNFGQTVYENKRYEPRTVHVPGVGDLAKSTDWENKKLLMGLGVNFLKWQIAIPKARRWSSENPWLYQMQLAVVDTANRVVDVATKQFGMRSFTQDTLHKPKGMFYLNGKPVRLRGANNMGNLMLSVMRKDTGRLIDDILLAKITNMNYLRMTQMPVQQEVYEYCDRLGMMTQTDLPLFGVLRRNKWAETVRQAHEMERLVRSHPCNIMVTYINERFPNAEGNPHRHLDTYEDFAKFFSAADAAVLSANPDRVIKAGDGDYDPPSPGLPDNHVYNFWYNGHGLGIGQMIKGYWVPVKPGWYYGCGEFGAEGLDDYNTMKKYYPKEWLPATDTSYWDPSKISQSQTFRFHYMWFNKQANIREWISTSQLHQEQATRLMTEAFRRNNDLISTAIHLFIDAWPAGWMKAVMDVDRQPKPAWYAYRDALTPLALNWRSDRMHYFGGQQLQSELWLCNDLNSFPQNAIIKYQIEVEGRVIQSSRITAAKVINGSLYQGTIDMKLPPVQSRSLVTIRASIFDARGNALHEAMQEFSVLPSASKIMAQVMAAGNNLAASQLLKDLNIQSNASTANAKTIVISDVATYQERHGYYDSLVATGKKLVFLNLPEGAYTIAGDTVRVVKPTMGAYYFVSNATSHPLAKQLQERDMKFWYDGESGMIQPMLKAMVLSNNWTPVLITGNTGWTARNAYANAVSEKPFGKGSFVICQVLLNNRVPYNPAARTIAEYLFR